MLWATQAILFTPQARDAEDENGIYSILYQGEPALPATHTGHKIFSKTRLKSIF